MTAPDHAAPGGLLPTDEQIWAVCAYRRDTPCESCPATIQTAYGPGTQGCRVLAEGMIRKVYELVPPPSAEQPTAAAVDERKEFEEFCHDAGGDFCWSQDGKTWEYSDFAWQVWQARASCTAQPEWRGK